MQRASISLLTVCGLEEIESHRTSRVSHVLSILDPDWPDPEDFAAYDAHRRTILRFHDIVVPMPGHVPPEPEHVAEILAFGDSLVADAADRADGHLLIHCHMGISRSTAAMAMLMQQAEPETAEETIIERLFAMRSQAWPNARMTRFADDMLGRGGRLSAAVARLHARQIAEKPHLAKVMRELGRSTEVDAAERLAA